MPTQFIVSPWEVPFAIHEMDAEARRRVIDLLRQRATAEPGETCLFRPLMRGGRAVIDANCWPNLLTLRMSWAEAMWLERHITGMVTVDAMVREMAAALERKTKAFNDELALHHEIHAALRKANIPFQTEVPIPEAGRIDLVVRGCLGVEVKAKTGGGRAPLRQLFRYLEDPRFEGGVILSTKPVDLPMANYLAADGRVLPVRKIELWKNAI